MLRGKFGQIGKEFRDGHITMDAFEQAAFRDHIRSGERIMYLASMGQLKHKRTRNTIAAEPTPRSSCPSSAGATAAHAARAAASDPNAFRYNTRSNKANRDDSDPVPQGANKAARLGSALTAVRNPKAKQVEPEHGNKRPEDTGDASPQSHSRLIMSAAYRGEDGSDHDDWPTSRTPASRRPRVGATSSGRRSVRPQSAGPVGRRPRSPSVGAARRATQDDTTMKRGAAEDVPLHVGPEIVALSAGVAGVVCGGRGVRPTSGRRRPASAGGVAAAEKKWRPAQETPNRVVRRGFGGQGRGGRGRNGGGRGGRGGRDVGHKGDRIERPIPKSRVPGGESTARAAEGSFAESVIKSARPFADYDFIFATAKARPKSAGAATGDTAHAPVFDPESRESHALAAATRFMPVAAIHKAFKGHRLAAVQAWDPHAAAAVRAARAETLLRRKRFGRTGPSAGGASMLAAAEPSDRRQPGVTGVGGRKGGAGPRCRDENDQQGRQGVGPSSTRRRKGAGRGGETAHRDRASKEFAPAVSVANGTTRDSGHGSGSKGIGARNPAHKELDKVKEGYCSSGPSTAAGSSCRGSTTGSVRGSSRKSEVTLSTERASTATGQSSSSRGSGGTSGRATSRRSAPSTSHSYSCSTSRSDEIAAEERRVRLLAELETLRRRVADAEGLLQEVDSCLQSKPKNKKRPGTTTSRATTNLSGRHSNVTRASLAATAGNTSAKSSAEYGAFNLGELRMCPLVVTHPANAFRDEL